MLQLFCIKCTNIELLLLRPEGDDLLLASSPRIDVVSKILSHRKILKYWHNLPPLLCDKIHIYMWNTKCTTNVSELGPHIWEKCWVLLRSCTCIFETFLQQWNSAQKCVETTKKEVVQMIRWETMVFLLLTSRIWNSIILVVKLLGKQNNLWTLLIGYEEYLEMSKYTQIGDT